MNENGAKLRVVKSDMPKIHSHNIYIFIRHVTFFVLFLLLLNSVLDSSSIESVLGINSDIRLEGK